MFERFTEAGRRALFFARYEASEQGSATIETEYVLLGLMREPRSATLVSLLTSSGKPLKTLREEIRAECLFREKVSTSIEIPFSAEVKRALELTVQEADALNHSSIDAEHMLLGLLRVEGSVAEKILTRNRLRLNDVREALVGRRGRSDPHRSPRNVVLDQVNRIKDLVQQLGSLSSDEETAIHLMHQIHVELDSLAEGLSPPEESH